MVATRKTVQHKTHGLFQLKSLSKNTSSYTRVITRKEYSGYCKTDIRETDQLEKLLNQVLTPGETHSSMKDSSPFAIGNPLSAKSARKVVKAPALAPETVMNFAANATHQLVIIRKEQTLTKSDFQLRKITRTTSFIIWFTKCYSKSLIAKIILFILFFIFDLFYVDNKNRIQFSVSIDNYS